MEAARRGLWKLLAPPLACAGCWGDAAAAAASASAGEGARTGESPCWGPTATCSAGGSPAAAAAGAAGTGGCPAEPREARLPLLPPAALMLPRVLPPPPLERSQGLGRGFRRASAGAASGLGGLSLMSVCRARRSRVWTAGGRRWAGVKAGAQQGGQTHSLHASYAAGKTCGRHAAARKARSRGRQCWPEPAHSPGCRAGSAPFPASPELPCTRRGGAAGWAPRRYCPRCRHPQRRCSSCQPRHHHPPLLRLLRLLWRRAAARARVSQTDAAAAPQLLLPPARHLPARQQLPPRCRLRPGAWQGQS